MHHLLKTNGYRALVENILEQTDLLDVVTRQLWISLLKEILIVIGIIAIACILLCIRVIIKKDGKFSSQHISENKRMKQDGIHCATSQDREARRIKKNKLDISQF